MQWRGTQVGSAMIRHFVRRVNQPESDLTQPSVRRRVIPAPAEVERRDCVVDGDPSVGCASMSIRGGVRQRGSGHNFATQSAIAAGGRPHRHSEGSVWSRRRKVNARLPLFQRGFHARPLLAIHQLVFHQR